MQNKFPCHFNTLLVAKLNSMANASIQQLKTIASRLRILSLKATTEAGSGHPTSCLSAAELIAGIFFHAMRYDPKNPKDPRNDRFVLSKGHAAPLLWAAWAEAGFIEEEQLLTLRQLNSNLEGHPTPRFPWVDIATGSLGQGLSAGCGMAVNAKYLDKTDVKTFVLLGDGECAEGSVWEAASFAGHYRLNNLIALVDINKWGQSEETMYRHRLEVYQQKFAACGMRTLPIDGHDMAAVVQALDSALSEQEKPTAILAKTEKGKGVSFLEGKPGFHGKALNRGELQKALAEIGESPRVDISIASPRGAAPAQPIVKEPGPPGYRLGEKVATRAAYGSGLVKLGAADPRVVALDGDTKNSTFTEKFLANFPNRFFECFIAEQNMVGVALGLAARGKIPFASTFGCFLTRAHDQIRMAGISRLPIKLCGSHAGVAIGEDGPSQMALEDFAMMRPVPQCAVLCPADGVAAERLVAEAARYAGMVYLRTQRPATEVIYPNEEKFPIGGSKILKKSDQDKITVVAAGITLLEALQAYAILKKEGMLIRVIDCYSIKPIDAQGLTEAGRNTGGIITVEDHYPEGGLGEAVLEAVGPHGIPVHKLAVNQIPRSGKPAELMALCGIDSQAIVEKVRGLL